MKLSSLFVMLYGASAVDECTPGWTDKTTEAIEEAIDLGNGTDARLGWPYVKYTPGMYNLRKSTITKYFGQLQNYYEYTLGDVKTMNENGFLLKAADTNCRKAPCYNSRIWYLTPTEFEATKSVTSTEGKKLLMAIKAVHGIDWHQVTYDKMTTPGFSLLAYVIHLQQRGFMPISGNNDSQLDICDQLTYCDTTLFENSSRFIRTDVELSCQQRDNDIMFVVDSSGSVGSAGFARVRNFLKEVKSYMGSTSRIGVVRFATNSELIWELDDGLDGFTNAVTNMAWTMGGTYTAKGLDLAYDHMLLRGRRSATKTIVLMTDGYTSNQSAYDAEIKKIKGSSVSFNLQAIGFGYTMNANVNMEDLKEFNQPPQILDSVTFDNPASAIIQDICAGAIGYQNIADFETCSYNGQSMNIAIDLSHKNTFTIESNNNAYVVYSFSSQKPTDHFNDGQFVVPAGQPQEIKSGDEPQKIYINVFPQDTATDKTCVKINSSLTRSATTVNIGTAKTCHDNETCQANGDGTGSCVCSVPLENGACPYGSYYPAQHALYAKRALFNTLEAKMTSGARSSVKNQPLRARYLQRVKDAVNSFSSNIVSHKKHCKNNHNGESHRQIDAATLLDLIKEDNLCKIKSTLKNSLKGAAQAHGCGSASEHKAVKRAEKTFNKLLARDAELREQCNH